MPWLICFKRKCSQLTPFFKFSDYWLFLKIVHFEKFSMFIWLGYFFHFNPLFQVKPLYLININLWQRVQSSKVLLIPGEKIGYLANVWVTLDKTMFISRSHCVILQHGEGTPVWQPEASHPSVQNDIMSYYGL